MDTGSECFVEAVANAAAVEVSFEAIGKVFIINMDKLRGKMRPASDIQLD